MTKTTTGSSRLTVILSWVIALVCLVGGVVYLADAITRTGSY